MSLFRLPLLAALLIHRSTRPSAAFAAAERASTSEGTHTSHATAWTADGWQPVSAMREARAAFTSLRLRPGEGRTVGDVRASWCEGEAEARRSEVPVPPCVGPRRQVLTVQPPGHNRITAGDKPVRRTAVEPAPDYKERWSEHPKIDLPTTRRCWARHVE